jgi:hypothetical protein
VDLSKVGSGGSVGSENPSASEYRAAHIAEVHADRLVQEIGGWSSDWHALVCGNGGHVAKLTPKELNNYQPRKDLSHYRLGMRLEGLTMMLERIGFIQTTETKLTSEICKNDDRWTYSKTYKRDADMSWLDREVGPIKDEGLHGRINVTCYDVCQYIRNWLKRNGFQGRSLCEVVLTEKEFADLRPYVGKATVFWSHMQREPLLGQHSTLRSMAQFFRSEDMDPFVWIDYASLRQLEVNDFVPLGIVELVRDIGRLVACIDSELAYTKRSFCILEIFAGVVGATKLNCITYAPAEKLLNLKVATHEAKTGNHDEQNNITSFIQRTIGFEKLDRVVTLAIQEGHR